MTLDPILIVGLGNPGKRYAATRHNVGFLVADRLVERAGGAAWREKFSGHFAQVELEGQRILVLKPMTYMNASGESVGPACSFFKIGPGSLLVVHDELDLPFGEVRLKRGGGEAGHRGLRSVTRHVGTRDYVRLRMGIGRPPPDFPGEPADFVLQAFAPPEQAHLDEIVERAASAAALLAGHGLQEAMNRVNRREKS